MKISVIIPNYNDVRVERSINSVIAQSYKNVELIVVDGLSNNSKVLDIYKSSNLSKLIREKDTGIFDALNKGVIAANGDIIYLMGSDDFLPDTDTFKRVVDVMSNGESLDGVCIACEFSNSNGKIIRKWYPGKISSKKIKLGILPPHFSLFLRKEIYDINGHFKNEQFGNVACDSIWLIDLALSKPDLKIKVLNEKKLVMEYGGASTGSLKGILKQFRVVHKYARNKKLPFWFLLSFIKASSKVFQFRIA